MCPNNHIKTIKINGLNIKTTAESTITINATEETLLRLTLSPRIIKKISSLKDAEMRKVDLAIKVSLGLQNF